MVVAMLGSQGIYSRARKASSGARILRDSDSCPTDVERTRLANERKAALRLGCHTLPLLARFQVCARVCLCLVDSSCIFAVGVSRVARNIRQ